MSKCLYIASDECKKYFPTYNESNSDEIHKNSKKLSNDFFKVSAKHIPTIFYLIWWWAASWKSVYVEEIIERNQWNNWKDKNQWGVYFEWSLSNYENLIEKINLLIKYDRTIEIHYIMPQRINEAYYFCSRRNRKLKDETFIRTHIESKNITDYWIQNYNYDKIAKKTDILIEFSNDLPEPNLRDWDISNDDNKHIEFIESHGSENIEWKRITGIFFGDAHFGRWFEYFTREWFKKESDYFEKFYQDEDIKNNLEEKIHRRLYGFDIVWLNLETAVASKQECQKSSKSIVLKTLPKFLNNFKKVWFNYYNIANNHSFDCGRSWFNSTKKHLEKNNLNYFGNMAGEENILKQEINGIKMAFIWVNDTFWNIPWAWINYKNLTKKIKEIKKEGYKIIINIHWWEEYKLENNKRQSDLAKKLVDAGVDLIIGHHPHVVQNYTTIDWVPVFYSLWNFVFDQPFPDTIKWMAVMFEIWEKWVKAFPIYFTRDNKRYFVDKFLDSKFEEILK
jgi:hypothetical protein